MDTIDFLSVFIATVVYVIIGAFWYSKFGFGKTWEKCIAKEKKSKKKQSKRPYFSYFISFVLGYIIAFFIAYIENFLLISSFWDGLIAGCIIWFGFVFTTQAVMVLFEKRSVKLVLIDVGYWLITFAILGGVLAG